MASGEDKLAEAVRRLEAARLAQAKASFSPNLLGRGFPDPDIFSSEYKAGLAEEALEKRAEAAALRSSDRYSAEVAREAGSLERIAGEIEAGGVTKTRVSPEAPKKNVYDILTGEQRPPVVSRGPRPTIAQEEMLMGMIERVRRVPKHLTNLIPLGVMAKILGAGVAKAAGLPGVTEAAELMGREEPSAQEFYRGEGDAIAELFGLATGYGDAPPVHDPRREAAIRASEDSGRPGLRPVPAPSSGAPWLWNVLRGPSNIEAPVTPEEIEAYKRRQ